MKKIMCCICLLSLYIVITTGAQQQHQLPPSQRYHRGYRPIDTTPQPSPTPPKGSALEIEQQLQPPVSWSWLWEWLTLPLGRFFHLIWSWLSWIWSLVKRVLHFLWDVAYLRALWQDHVTWPLFTWLVRGVLIAQFYWALRIMYKIILSS